MKPDRWGWVQHSIADMGDTAAHPDVDELWHAGGQRVRQNIMTTWRRMCLYTIPLIIMVGLVVRLGYLQIVQSDTYQQLVEHNQYRIVSLPAPRGAILDRTGKAVVDNTANFVLTVIPASIPNKDPGRQTYYDRLSAVSGQTMADLKVLLANKKYSRSEAVPIVTHIPYEHALQLAVQLSDIPGSSIDAYPTRSYRYGEALSAVLGYIGQVTDAELVADPALTRVDEVGKTGIEEQYNRLLMGQPGSVTYERTGQNQFISAVRRKDPVPGATLKLTIDAELQQRLYDQLSAEVKKGHFNGGAAVAVDPRNGDILAMVSAPTYDSNWFVDPSKKTEVAAALVDPTKPLLNRAITGLFPSGSIIKPLLGVAALAEHIVTPQTTVLSVGGFKVGANFFPDWKAGGHGITNLAKALAESVNTYFYEVGGGYQQQPGLGVDRIVKWLQTFGWGVATGIDLPHEAAGFLPTKAWRDTTRPSPWRLGDTYHLSIGQGDLEVTPLQVAMAQAAVANGGTLYQPRLVTEIDSADGAVLQSKTPVVTRTNISSAANFQAVQFGMRQGVLAGSSRAMQSLSTPVAGKTGTAQFGNQGKTHAWYTAYGPYDQPTILLTIIIEGGGEGNVTALPIAKDVLGWYFTRPATVPTN